MDGDVIVDKPRAPLDPATGAPVAFAREGLEGLIESLQKSRTVVINPAPVLSELLNLGDVVVEGDDLFGDGVNIAARTEALADAGAVFASNTVYGSLRKMDSLAEEEDLHQ
jgi:class 3 adenylate cyclase